MIIMCEDPFQTFNIFSPGIKEAQNISQSLLQLSFLVTEGRKPTEKAVFQVYRSFSEGDKAAQAQSHTVN